MNNSITNTKIETMIKNLPKKQKSRTRWLHSGLLSVREELMSILLKVFQKTAEEGKLSNSLHKATITMIPKPEKDNTKREIYKPILLMNIDAKILNKTLPNRI